MRIIQIIISKCCCLSGCSPRFPPALRAMFSKLEFAASCFLEAEHNMSASQQKYCQVDLGRFTAADSKIVVSAYHFYKRWFDTVAAFFMLIPGIPIILALMLLVKLTSKGPAIYSQVRVGKEGKLFTMYKIRTMRTDAEEKTGAVWAVKKDPRTTFIGKILRRLHLDELPQLFNVIRGEMALVGPRPERPEFVEILDKKIKGYSLRLLVLPGVTGYAQLNLPADRELGDVRRKLALDSEYIENASLWFDFRLILGTVCRMFKYAHKTPLRCLGIYQTVETSPWAAYFHVPQANEITPLVGEQQLDILFSAPQLATDILTATGKSSQLNQAM